VVHGDGSPPATAPGDDNEGQFAKAEHLVLDELSERLDSLKLLRAGDDAHADVILEQFGARGRVEADMLDQLAVRPPLRHPDRFQEAHRTVVRALEVFDRNGARPPSSLKAGRLTPIASFVVQFLIRLIVRNYQKNVVRQLRDLYARREANSAAGTREFEMLRLARLQADRLLPGFQRSPGLPSYLAGGALLSALGSGLRGVLASVVNQPILLIAAAAGFVLLLFAAFWCILTAAAIARRRTRIALDQPLRALWETIGAAGHPPRDQSRQFATYAIILLVMAWIVLPIAITVAYTAGN